MVKLFAPITGYFVPVKRWGEMWEKVFACESKTTRCLFTDVLSWQWTDEWWWHFFSFLKRLFFEESTNVLSRDSWRGVAKSLLVAGRFAVVILLRVQRGGGWQWNSRHGEFHGSAHQIAELSSTSEAAESRRRRVDGRSFGLHQNKILLGRHVRRKGFLRRRCQHLTKGEMVNDVEKEVCIRSVRL